MGRGCLFVVLPKLGEHSDEILKDLGYSKQEIELLKKNKII